MPYMTCPACRQTSGSAAVRATRRRGAHCDALFEGGNRADGPIWGWILAAVSLIGHTGKGVEHGTR